MQINGRPAEPVPATTRRAAIALGAGTLATAASLLAGCADIEAHEDREGATLHDVPDRAASVESILGTLSLEDKISQLIVPAVAEAGSGDACRWPGMDVTDLSELPRLAEALAARQYGGVCLFGGNMVGCEQTLRLTEALQRNNAAAAASSYVPYLMCADGEGGVVVRLNMGTRMTGSMAVGATGAAAEHNARDTGRILAEELAAVGVNVDLAPDADVNANPANPVIGVRSFGDDPRRVATLACALAEGISEAGVVPAFKHFPGHGDTGTDSHIGTATVNKSLDELRACELVPFKAAIDAGADLIMTAHITCPSLDHEVVFADGSRGYLPATLSHTILTDVLRAELGYEGAIMSDSLTMDAIEKAGIVEGAQGSAEYAANIAEMALNAGVDILLNPRDLVSDEAVRFYDEYLRLLCNKVEAGTLDAARIDESVRRVLELKERHGILVYSADAAGLDARIAEAEETVGSAEHHVRELAMAREAITVVKNDAVLPFGPQGVCVLLVRSANEAPLAAYAVRRLKEQGLIPEDAHVVDFVSGEEEGSASSAATLVIDYYYDLDTGEAHYTDVLSEAVAASDVVLCETTTWGTAALAANSVQRQTIERALGEAHAAGARFVQLSDNLPYDAACYTDADAQVLAYMSAGMGMDPTDRWYGSDAPAFNANFVAAVEAVFGGFAPSGTLPVNVPVLKTSENGEAVFGNELLFERGFGLTYA